MEPSKRASDSQKPRERKCCGVIEEAAEAAREKRYNRTTPQPWIVRKLMVGVTLGIMGYAAYVYIQQLCLPMIRKKAGAPAGRGTGIALLVVFCVLYLWMIWAYMKIVMTSPGYARDYIQKSERPLFPASAPLRESWQSTALSHESSAPPQDVEAGPHQPRLSATTSRTNGSHRRENGLAGPSYEDLLRRDAAGQDPNAGTLDSIAVPKPAFNPETPNTAPSQSSPVPASSPTITSHQQHQTTTNEGGQKSFLNSKLKLKKSRPAPALTFTPSVKQEKVMERERRLEGLNIARRPPTTPVLQPVHRYCTIDGIVKPYRAHHCRACGTCVLKYDHHCPWIGQCVGARNHKFFLNFCQATMVLTSYILGTVVAYTVTSTQSLAATVNPQEIVIIALSGLFLLFTALLVVSHTHMILKGQTTVESMQIRSMREREEQTLARGFSWWEFAAKQRKVREWDQEWGRLSKEGNIWWKGSGYEEWVDVMGRNWVGWILPIGRSGRDGLDYPVNPRFDSEGRWRRRAEWPQELQ